MRAHIKRGCKIGLDLAKNNSNVEIHFCLDRMNFEGVLSKKGVPYKDEDDYCKSFTSAELRYIYRNKEELKGNVIFVEEGEIIETPWDQEPELWKVYEPKKWQKKKEYVLLQENNENRSFSQASFEEKLIEVKEKFSQNLHKCSKNLEEEKTMTSLWMSREHLNF